MTRERDDPEKRNLLNEPKEEKKKRPYTSKNKSDRRSCDSSNNNLDHRKRGSSYKVSSTEQRAEFLNKPRSLQSTPYQSENKNSWWFWTFVSQQNAQPSRKSEDTCSCGTCALKKFSSECACVGCLLLLFTISIIVAFLVVFKTVPSGQDCHFPCKETMARTCPPKCKDCKGGDADSERLKRKIEMLNNKKLENGFVGVDEFRKNNDKGNHDGLGLIDVPGASGINFGPSFRELNSADEPEHKLLNDVDLSNVLDSDLNNVDGSGKLREFYKKLLETDAKIKSLKKFSDPDAPYIEEDVLKSPERSRRALKLFHSPKRYRALRQRRSLFGKHQTNETGGATKFGNKTRLKRFGKESEEPTGFVIEKKKLLVQYKPMGKNRIPVKKCQHAPVGTHTHEKQMMHPFYKNTQRLDILLDKFLNKNLPEIISDPFGLDDLFKQDRPYKHGKHPKPHKNVNIIVTDPIVNQIPKLKQKLKNEKAGDQVATLNNFEAAGGTPEVSKMLHPGGTPDVLKMINPAGTPDVLKILNPESTTPYERVLHNHKLNMMGKLRNEKKKMVTSSTSDFEVLLSISTIINPGTQRVTKATSEYSHMMTPIKDRIPNLRRLMQIKAGGEEEENLGYEDFTEMLTDENANHNEIDKAEQRKRRESAEATVCEIILCYGAPRTNVEDPKAHPFKPSIPPQGILNPNWKGAMPLYPDEINSMITNKQVDVPKPTLQIQELIDDQRKIRYLSDIEYVEDYLSSKYNNLVQQAQAYSDYGVLEGKKESRNEKESPTVHTAPNHKIKLLADANVFKASLPERLKRGKLPKTQLIPINIPGRLKEGDPRNEAFENDNVELIWSAQTGSKKFIKEKEGFRFQLRPTTSSREDVDYNRKIIKMVSKHLKLTGATKGQPKVKSPPLKPSLVKSTYAIDKLVYSTKVPELTTEITKEEAPLKPSLVKPTYPIVKLVYNTKVPEPTTEITKEEVDDNENENENENGIVVDMTRRHLLSTEFESSHDFRDYKDSTGYRAGNRENNASTIDRFIDKLHMNKYSDSSLALQTYIEEATAKNVKIYGTPRGYYSKNVADDNAHMLLKASTPSDQLKDPRLVSNSKSKDPPNSIVTINKSLVNLGKPAPENFSGKILMLVNDPEFGQQHFNLMFDVPLIMNFKEELIMMNDSMNYPYVNNQFDIFTDSTIDQEVTETNSKKFQSRPKARRLKRESEVTATWSDKSTPANFPEKDSEVFQIADKKIDDVKVTVTITPDISSGSISSVPAAPSMGIIAANRNISAINATSKTNRSADKSSKLLAVGDNMTLSDFFAVAGNWFKALEYGKMDKPRKSSGSVVTDLLLTLNSSMNSNITTTDSAYPMYDSDMIENIGHRSRVLLSIEDCTVNVTDVKLVTVTNTDNVTDNATAVDGNVSNATTSMTAVVTDRRGNLTTTNKNKFKKSIQIFPSKLDRPRNFRAIVKRNADDSNLIFWNDMYDDDEYGIRTDNMDNDMKSKIDEGVVDKQALKKKDFLKRSGRWVQNKIRKFARKINPHSDAVANIHSDKERVPRSIGNDENFGLVDYSELHDNREYNHPVMREKEGRDETEEDYPDMDQKSLFAALSANMKEVCKNAAKAVQETRDGDKLPNNVQKKGVSDDEFKQGSISNALMQQLVRLLTDLVDFQLQQKTCRKLPPELQTFLEWLTYSKDETENPEQGPVTEDHDELIFKPTNEEEYELEQADLRDRPEDKVDFPNAEKPGDRQENMSPGDRIQFLDAIHSIKELLEEYDTMPDSEKSKMTGVKGYLEKQLAFLSHQLSAYDLFAFLDKHNSKKRNQFFDKYDRKKRHIFRMSHQKTKLRPPREPRKFVKNFGRKHTRTTAAYNDEAQITDRMINKKANENAEINHNLHQELLSKRNLKDVYYKAVAEAKKFSTAKRDTIQKDEISTFINSTTKRQH